MAQESLSSTTQSIGNAGYLKLEYIDPTQGGASVSVSFIPTLVQMTRPQYAVLQHINYAVGGQCHIYSISTNEPLQWQVAVHDLPFLDNDPRIGHPTHGAQSLFSFIRTTLNYSERLCQITTPDGQIETMRFVEGLANFVEGEGQTQRANRWTGTLTFMRYIP